MMKSTQINPKFIVKYDDLLWEEGLYLILYPLVGSYLFGNRLLVDGDLAVLGLFVDIRPL